MAPCFLPIDHVEAEQPGRGAARAVLMVPECSPPQPCSEVPPEAPGGHGHPLGKGWSNKTPPPPQHTLF